MLIILCAAACHRTGFKFSIYLSTKAPISQAFFVARHARVSTHTHTYIQTHESTDASVVQDFHSLGKDNLVRTILILFKLLFMLNIQNQYVSTD